MGGFVGHLRHLHVFVLVFCASPYLSTCTLSRWFNKYCAPHVDEHAHPHCCREIAMSSIRVDLLTALCANNPPPFNTQAVDSI